MKGARDAFAQNAPLLMGHQTQLYPDTRKNTYCVWGGARATNALPVVTLKALETVPQKAI